MKRIFINPGHDLAVDPGCINSAYNVTEAQYVAEIGNLLERYLTTRYNDRFEVHILQRDNLAGESGSYYDSVVYNANRVHADLFVSLHCNACQSHRGMGAETYFYTGNEFGRKVAQSIQDRLCSRIGFYNRGVKDNTGFIVLRCTNCDSVLVEIGFLDNEYDIELLLNNKKEIALAIADAINNVY